MFLLLTLPGGGIPLLHGVQVAADVGEAELATLFPASHVTAEGRALVQHGVHSIFATFFKEVIARNTSFLIILLILILYVV